MKFDKLIIATGNRGKYLEFQEIINSLDKDFANEIIFAPDIAKLIVEETGKSYAQNSMLKSVAWAEKTGLACLADDSGLEVEALNGAPGLFSARIIPGNDDEKVSWLLSELAHSTNRRARFAASLTLCVPNEYIHICEGYCYGRIKDSPAGNNGFGYDPVFVPDGYNLTFAELDSHTKNLISHRANAFRKILATL